MFILTSEQQALADKVTIEKNGITGLDLMEVAATKCFHWLHQRLQGQAVKLHVFCGIGNNGGDGLVIARHLFQHGYDVHCYVVNFSDKRTPEFLENYNRLKEIGVWPTVIKHKEEFPNLTYDDIVVDAIFGAGISRSPEGFTKELINHINNSKAFTLSIDLPSGLFSNAPVLDEDAVIMAEHILTFQQPKLAFLLPGNKKFVATWELIDIGLDEEFINSLPVKTLYSTKNLVNQLYRPKDKWAHKGDFGHSLIVGGSFGKIGAVSLASKAALKMGSGLVSAYVPKCGYSILQVAIPEVMVEVDQDQLLTYFNFKTKPTVLGIGPGMGTAEKTANGYKTFLKQNKLPLVIDADGINLISKDPELLEYLPKRSVLTPHPGELKRLIGPWKNDFEKLEKIEKFSRKNKLIVVAKGAHTVIVEDDMMYFNSTGNPGLSTAGSGDVLTGLITGLIAQKYDALNAAILGVYLHGRCADIAVPEIGMESFTATSIIEYLPKAILDLFRNDQPSVEEPSDETSEAPKDKK